MTPWGLDALSGVTPPPLLQKNIILSALTHELGLLSLTVRFALFAMALVVFFLLREILLAMICAPPVHIHRFLVHWGAVHLVFR